VFNAYDDSHISDWLLQGTSRKCIHLIISPLTALAEEQVRGLNAREQVAVRMNNDSKKTMKELEEKLGKFLYRQYSIRGETRFWE
jgi:superfamily II DNA helicase RecQ